MSIKFIDAVKNHKDLYHQNKAWEFLQSSVHKEILDEFARIYRNQKIEPTLQNLPEPGVFLIKEFEGCELKAYYDPHTGGLPITIGWGSTRRKDGTRFMIGNRITQEEADDLLYFQLRREFLPPLQKIPFWNEDSFPYYTKKSKAQFIRNKDIRFMSLRLETNWWTGTKIAVVNTHLVALKEGPRFPGPVEI
jgi:hypothetical protein